MASKLFPYFIPALDEDGNPGSGATWSFYTSDTNSPASVWADPGMTIALGSEVEADGAGRFPPIYYDEDSVYRAVQRSATGDVTWFDLDPFEGILSGNYRIVDTVTVKTYGALGNGTTNDTASIQAAINSLSFGGQVQLGRGTFVYTSITVPDGVTLVGDNDYGTTLLCSSTTGKITLGVNAGLSNLKVSASVTRGAGAEFVFINSTASFVRNCVFSNYSLAIKVGTIPGSIVIKPVIDNCNFFNPVVGAGSGAIEINYYSNAIVTNCVGSGASFPAQQPDFGIRLRCGDTAYLVNNNFTLHGKALLLDPPVDYNSYATNISNCTFDSSGSISGGNYACSAEIIPAGGVYDVLISNSWFGLSSDRSGCFVEPQGAGVVDGIAFTGCEFPDNGDCGLIVDGAGAINWSVTGGWSAANVNAGIRAAGATKRFTITGHRAGPVADRGPNNIGIQVDNASAADFYNIVGNNVFGNTNSNLFDGGTGNSARVADNAGSNGVTPPAPATVGASPWSYTAGHTEEVLYLRGGTVSDIKQGGVTVATASPAAIRLSPNEQCVVTYTVAPTAVVKRL